MAYQTIIFTGPSGSGKDHILDSFFASNNDPFTSFFCRATTCTTRAMRINVGERQGHPYHFYSPEEFNALVAAGQMLEWAQTYENFYGNTLEELQRRMASGKIPIYRVDTKGARTLKDKLPSPLTVGVVPRTFENLEERLKGRKSETSEEYARRLVEAPAEIQCCHEICDYIIVNGYNPEALEDFRDILQHSFPHLAPVAS